jgi:hypothetical protein
VVFSLSLLRDVPWRVGGGILAVFPLPALIVVGLLLVFHNVDGAAGLGFCILVVVGSFVVVTRGHVVRMISEERVPVSIPDDVRTRYMQHVTRHQLAGIALMLVIFAAVIAL